jgi:4-hydroxy-3-polyprenylbenzoate decarboxylase
MTGATGAVFGIRTLQALAQVGIETHLVASKWARQTAEHETDLSWSEVQSLASHYYSSGDMGAAISSGSFLTGGMIITPCSMRTLAAIAQGHGDTLVHRAADVILKERRPLILLVRETPLSDVHLENMLKLSRMGVVILPPVPAFYNHPKTIDDLVDHVVARVLDQVGIDPGFARRWDGVMRRQRDPAASK